MQAVGRGQKDRIERAVGQDLIHGGINLAAISGCSSAAYPFSNINGYIREIVEAFGPRRCFWGTDFTRRPIIDRCTYAETITHFTEHMDFLGQDDKEWIMGRAVCEYLGWDM